MQVQSVVDESAALPHTQTGERKKICLCILMFVWLGIQFRQFCCFIIQTERQHFQPAGIEDRFYGALGGLRFEKS